MTAEQNNVDEVALRLMQKIWTIANGYGPETLRKAQIQVLLINYLRPLLEQPQRSEELSGVADVLTEGDGFWHSCSGCLEQCEGHDVGHYPYSNILKCQLGGGCSECGGIGAVWDTTDYEDMARSMLASEQPQRAAVPDQVVIDNLSTMIRRFIHAANRSVGDTTIKVVAGLASDLLGRYGLQGNILRDQLAAAPEAKA